MTTPAEAANIPHPALPDPDTYTHRVVTLFLTQQATGAQWRAMTAAVLAVSNAPERRYLVDAIDRTVLPQWGSRFIPLYRHRVRVLFQQQRATLAQWVALANAVQHVSLSLRRSLVRTIDQVIMQENSLWDTLRTDAACLPHDIRSEAV